MFQSIKPSHAFAALAALSILSAPAAMAGTAAGTSFDVKLTINSGCTITNSSTAVDFGSVLSGGSKPSAQTKGMTINCTSNIPFDFHAASTNNFNMKSGSTLIPYTIKAGSSSTALGTAAPASLLFAYSGSPQIVTLTFDISTWTGTAAAGVYTDTVTVNVDF